MSDNQNDNGVTPQLVDQVIGELSNRFLLAEQPERFWVKYQQWILAAFGTILVTMTTGAFFTIVGLFRE
ncbi:hypothetical protein [Pseudoalteromonas piscicida]|uniref:hypothetical protein n=1 Tax=Pseudoalteromonas piscicida TaxID=43662 RepID=UPI00309E716B